MAVPRKISLLCCLKIKHCPFTSNNLHLVRRSVSREKKILGVDKKAVPSVPNSSTSAVVSQDGHERRITREYRYDCMM